MSRTRNRRSRQQPKIPWLTKQFQTLTSPLPPLEWASEEQLTLIHDASMWILENVGMAFMDDEALDLWEKAGAKVDRSQELVYIGRDHLLELISHAPSEFTWHARNPAHNLTIGRNHINFAPNSGMPYVSDLENGRRPSTLTDYENFVKLAHTVPYFHFTGGPLVEPQDVPPSLRHLRRTRVMAHNTDRAIRSVAHGRIIPTDIIHMMEIIYGGRLPGTVTGGVVNVTSPLRLDDRMLGGIITFGRANQATIITPFIMAGATSPITIASALAQQNAEALGGIAFAQLANPGAPVIYGGFTQNVDMRSGSPAFGGPEGAWALIVGAQLARKYNLPYRASGSLTNAKIPDAQAAYESQWTQWPAVLAHTNMVLHSVGWLDAGLVASYEKFVIDTESLAMFTHWLNGFDITPETLAVQAIQEIGIGGHHFGTELTQAHYRTAFHEPVLTDRQNYETWQNNGGQNALQRANTLYKQLLNTHQPPPLDPAIAEELDAFISQREKELEGVDLYA